MPRIRTVKPGFFRHELLQELEDSHVRLRPMLVFEGLWTQCDKFGRFEWKPRTLKLDILPFVKFEIEKTMELLVEHKLISRYEVLGKLYGQIESFTKHQRVSGKEAQEPSRLPSPGSTGEAIGTQTGSDWEYRNGVQERSTGTGTDKAGRDLSEEVFEIAKVHPKIVHRKKGPTRIEQEVIAQAIAQDGRDLVLAGTRNLADAVAKWPISEHKFIPEPVKFYQQENYKLDPAHWDRVEVSKLAGSQGMGISAAQDEEPDAHTLALREKFVKQHQEEIAKKKAAMVGK